MLVLITPPTERVKFRVALASPVGGVENISRPNRLSELIAVLGVHLPQARVLHSSTSLLNVTCFGHQKAQNHPTYRS